MARVHVGPSPVPMLVETRRKSTETRVDEARMASTTTDMRRCSASITDLINNADVADAPTVVPRPKKHRTFKPALTQKAPPPNTWRRRVRQLIKYPHATRLGRVRHYGLLVAIVFNYVLMMVETADGPANGGSDPKYHRLPSATTFFWLDVVFTAVFGLDFALRWIVAKRQRKFWSQLVTWIDVLGLVPLGGGLFMNHVLHWDRALLTSAQQYLKLLRLFRIVRVTYMLRNVSGIRVLHATFLECIHPLQITLFFLVTIVMTMATLLYYVQPCDDSATCTFTDIINTGYYVMVTVATVGYGDQVPDLTNPLAAVVAIAAMIFGALYLAMPLAIIGIKYEITWRRFENVSRTTRSTLELRATLKAISIRPLHPQSNHATVQVHLALDAIAQLARLTDAYLTIVSDDYLRHVERLMLRLFQPDAHFLVRDDNLNTAFLEIHSAGDRAVQTLQALQRHLAPFLPPSNHHLPAPKATAIPQSLARRQSTLALVAETLMTKATRVAQLHRVDTATDLIDPNVSFRRRLRFHLRATSHGSWANRLYLSSILLSVAVFYAESVPELQAFGPTTHLCHMLMESYCHANPSPAANPGCFVWQNATSPAEPSIPVHFYCDERDNGVSTSDCFGVGFNFGGNASTMKCAESFAQPAKVCNLRECQRGHEPILDLTHYWIYVEVYLGIAFTVELSLRLYVSNHRRRLLRSPSTWIDILAILPFYAQTLAGVAAGRMPMYVSSPVFPTFLSVLPILKPLRILKLGQFFDGSTVLARTAALTYERLAIPLFFLFLACASAGAIFFEIERGKACRAGVPCLYFGKDLMTTAIADKFPHGKRIQIQLDHVVQLKDMWRTTWMSLVTLTGVGYGDMAPRSPAGRLVDILTMVFGSCYTAMPLSLIGGQFYQCYELYLKENQVHKVSTDNSVKIHVHRPTVFSKQVPTLSSSDCDVLASAQSALHVVDEMMANLYKLHRMRPSSVVLSSRLESFIVMTMDRSSTLKAQGPRRQSLLARIAPHTFGPPPPVDLIQREIVELRRLVRLASAVLTTMGLQLPRVVEAIVTMTAEVDSDE